MLRVRISPEVNPSPLRIRARTLPYLGMIMEDRGLYVIPSNEPNQHLKNHFPHASYTPRGRPTPPTEMLVWELGVMLGAYSRVGLELPSRHAFFSHTSS